MVEIVSARQHRGSVWRVKRIPNGLGPDEPGNGTRGRCQVQVSFSRVARAQKKN